MLRTLVLLVCSAAAALAQAPAVTSVANAASFNTLLCPGLLAAVYGSNFGTDATKVTVSVGGKPAFVYSPVLDGQINVQIPFEASTGATTLTVTVGGVASAPFSITLSTVSPYFVTQNGSGSGLAAVYEGSTLVTAAAPAHAGDTVSAYAVGLGPTNPATPTGVAPATANTATLPTVTVGGAAATVTFAGVAKGGGGGIYVVNFTVPAGVSGTVPVVISIGGVSSATDGLSTAGPVTMPVVSTAAAPTVTGVQNAASYGTQLCPGVQAEVYGSGFGTTASNVSVSVGGKAGYVLGTVTPNQMLVQIPFEAGTGATTITVTVSGVASAPFDITLSATAPYFLTQNFSGSGLANAAENSTSTMVTLAAPAHPGDTVYAYAIGLGPTNPPTATGPTTGSNPTATLPTVTVGGVAAKVLSAGTTGYVGVYQVNFVVPPTGVQGTQPLVISIGGQTSSTKVTLAIYGVSSVVNNASFANAGTIAPGSIASVFANGLGSASTNETSGLFPSTQSESVKVTFNGEGAPMFHLIPTVPATSSQQIDLYVPSDLPTTGTVNVQLTTSAANYPNYTLTMVPASPGFYRFTDPKSSTQYVIAQFANSAWLALPASTTANLGLPACAASTSASTQCGEPANIGDYLVLYLTGLGLATPNGDPNGKPLPTGQNPPSDGSVLYETPTLPTVMIGGIATKVLFSGLVPGYAGEYQIDVQVPPGVASGDSIPVVVTMLGASDTTNISIQPSRVPPPNQ